MEDFLKNMMLQPLVIQVLTFALVLLVTGFLLYVLISLFLGIYGLFRKNDKTAGGAIAATGQESAENTEAIMQRQTVFARLFYLGRKILGIMMIVLGGFLIWEMATLLSARDLTGKVIYGIGGCGICLIIGGILCLIAKQNEKAF
jgi:predicted phage tail protein